MFAVSTEVIHSFGRKLKISLKEDEESMGKGKEDKDWAAVLTP